MLARTHDHAVCFHDEAVGLAREIADYVGPALGGGGAALLLARRERIDSTQQLLAEAGLNVSDLLRRGQLVLLDAQSLSSPGVAEQRCEPAHLAERAREHVKSLVSRWGQLRAFDELVDVLAAEGRHEDTMDVEAHWTSLQREVPFDLLCGYEFKRFGRGFETERSFQNVCDAHTDVYAVDGEEQTIDRLRREVVVLRHRLRALHIEDIASTPRVRRFTPASGDGRDHLLPFGQGAGAQPSTVSPDLGPLTAGRLLNVVVHDLQNLLSMLRWNALSAEATLPHDAPARDPVADILMGVERCTELTGDVLGITRGSAVEPVSLDDLVSGQRRLLTRVVGHKAKLGFELGCTSRVLLSRTSFCQAVTNLVVNACHAVSRGGHIQLRTTTAAGTPPSGQEYAVLEVSDDGAGIDPAILERLFEESFTTRASGNGLGLAIVRTVAEQARGRVEVESAVGRGSVFRVLLPAC